MRKRLLAGLCAAALLLVLIQGYARAGLYPAAAAVV